MIKSRPKQKVRCIFFSATSVRENPYDKLTQPTAHATWRDAFWAVWEACHPNQGGVALKEGPIAEQQQREFALIWEPRSFPFRLRVNDLLRIDGKMARVIRVTESAAVLLVNQPVREFKTRFDKPVKFQPQPKITRMSANAEIEILYRKANGAHSRARRTR